MELKLLMDKTVQRFLCLLVFYGFIATTILGFSSTSIVFNDINNMNIAATIQSSVFTIGVIIMLYHIFDSGHQLEAAISAAHRHLRRNVAGITNNNGKYERLIWEMEQNKTISPAGYFNLNHGGFLGVIGIFVTYIIVLLQFKVAEFGPKISCNTSANVDNSNATLLN